MKFTIMVHCSLFIERRFDDISRGSLIVRSTDIHSDDRSLSRGTVYSSHFEVRCLAIILVELEMPTRFLNLAA